MMSIRQNLFGCVIVKKNKNKQQAGLKLKTDNELNNDTKHTIRITKSHDAYL